MLVLMAGCAAPNGAGVATVDKATVDDSYARSELRLTVRSLVYDATVYVKPFERSGKLGLCGAYAADGNTAQRAVMAIRWRQAVLINGIDAGRASFFAMNDIATRPLEAACMVTEIAWQPGFATKPTVQVVDQITKW